MSKGKEVRKKVAKKEHTEHQQALKPLMKHLKSDEMKMATGKKTCK